MNTRFSSLLLFCVLFAFSLHVYSVDLHFDQTSPQAQFAAHEIKQALESVALPVEIKPLDSIAPANQQVQIILFTLSDENALDFMRESEVAAPAELKPEGYSIRTSSDPDRRSIWIAGYDDAGLMYGGLEAAEQIRIGGTVWINNTDCNPYMQMRGAKFNISLDVRTPSYSDVSDAAQNNIIEMWSMEFWKEYIDTMARYRYNFISFWNLHPFPSLVKVPDYPDVALNDVMRSTVEWNEHYDLEATGFDDPEILGNVETLKEMTIDEKIDFWRQVMRYGKDRNIDIYFVTWNIFDYGTEGKYGITDDIDNEITIDYFRKSVEQMFLTYPDLAGIGLTTGENMKGASFEEKEDWAFNTYGKGMLDAAIKQPERRFTLIHRQHMAGAKDIARTFSQLLDQPNIDFIFSFKYAKAHALSSTRQTYHHDFVEDIGSMKTIWTLRNDDVYHFRWGAPDFVREFIQNIPYEVSKGYYYGSDQYIWGREFLSLDPETPRQIEIVKHWYHWMLWGRLGYDPTLTNDRFAEIIQSRFPDANAEALFDAWQKASMVYPLTTGFHWGSLDFQWYIEACLSRPGPAQTESGFHDVNRFITLKPHPGTDNISIPDYVTAVTSGETPDGTTPLEVSEQLIENAERAMSLIADITSNSDRELKHTLMDIQSMCHMGLYYGHKIRGAVNLALYRETGDETYQENAINELTIAADHWKNYVKTTSAQYKNPLWTNRVGYVDWDELTHEVMNDIEIAKQ